MTGFDFKVRINDYSNPVERGEVERILKPFFQFVSVSDFKNGLNKKELKEITSKELRRAMRQCDHCEEGKA